MVDLENECVGWIGILRVWLDATYPTIIIDLVSRLNI